jgi:hypothetical protein
MSDKQSTSRPGPDRASDASAAGDAAAGNLLTLLSKLCTPGSACSFLSGAIPNELGFVHSCFRTSRTSTTTPRPRARARPRAACARLPSGVRVTIRAAIAEYIADSDFEGWRP